MNYGKITSGQQNTLFFCQAKRAFGREKMLLQDHYNVHTLSGADLILNRAVNQWMIHIHYNENNARPSRIKQSDGHEYISSKLDKHR